MVLATQWLRFENPVTVSWDGRQLAVASHRNRLTRPIAGPLLSASTVLQRASVGETVLRAYTLDAPSGRVRRYAPPVFYLFGRDWMGQAVRAEAPGFERSFGDWTMDRHRTVPAALYSPLPPRFDLTASFLGRGEKSLLFETPGGTVSVNVRDGLLDNDVSICDVSGCTAEASREPVLRNLSRMLGFGLEILVLGTFLVLVTRAARQTATADS
jgi:hypothetical protein